MTLAVTFGRTMAVNSCLLVFSLLIILSISYLLNAGYQLKDIEIQPEIDGELAKIFTAEDIAKYDGTDPSKPLLLAVKGVVFDVTKGKDFYGPGAAYHQLAAKDATRAMALWSLKEEDFTHDVTGLKDDQLKGLDEVFEGTYLPKYKVVGYMDYIREKYADKFIETGKQEL